MIKIEAIVPPFKLSEISEKLQALSIDGFLVTDAKECFAFTGSVTAYRGVECFVDFVSCVKIELIVEPDDASNTILALRSAIGNTHAQATILTSTLDKVLDVDASLPAFPGKRNAVGAVA
ncbi:P-II family nitrogen regulator [Rhizobium lusitanum]|uniref:Nitrogen regulatory protein P-II n=1 Tax=Rhizobium lusitanum TaxID=293958 RepID=A0A6L9UKZ7_9HYPH|nr:P-II family nitrogen regulator [Rhizobium lusitanum]NEI74787.1 P-II family nitrogen regulator [Rhizobium lusitanum]